MSDPSSIHLSNWQNPFFAVVSIFTGQAWLTVHRAPHAIYGVADCKPRYQVVLTEHTHIIWFGSKVNRTHATTNICRSIESVWKKDAAAFLLLN